MNPKVSTPRVVTFLLSSAAIAILFYSVVNIETSRLGLVVGSIQMPPLVTLGWYAMWQTFAMMFAVCLSIAFYGAGERFSDRLAEASTAADESEREKAFLVLVTLAGFAIPWLLRYAVLNDLPIADDESAYLFSAQLLADFSLTTPSPPFKLFYDRAFLINDGRVFSQYFLGWPALLAPFTWIGVPDAANPVYSAATIPPLFWLMKRLLGVRLAVVGVFGWLASPFAMLVASTLLSHTTCTMGLVWGFWLVLRASDESAPWWTAPAALFAFCLAFWVRPFTAAMMAPPWVLLLLWSWKVNRPQPKTIISSIAAVSILAGLFLAANWHLTGSPFGTMYSAYLDYARGNDWRFSLWITGDPDISAPDFRYDPSRFWLIGLALFRLFHTALGWPALALLVVVGSLDSRQRPLVASVALFLVGLVATHSAGIDSIGPVHVFELVPVLLILGLSGVRLTVTATPRPELAQVAVVAALVVGSAALYWPQRIESVTRLTSAGALPYEAVEKLDSNRKKVIFSSYPFVNPCATKPSVSFVFWRPTNSPGFDDSVLWLNHVSLKLDRTLMAVEFPERDGYLMYWNADCEIVLQDLRDPASLEVNPVIGPDGYDLDDIESELGAAAAALRP